MLPSELKSLGALSTAGGGSGTNQCSVFLKTPFGQLCEAPLD